VRVLVTGATGLIGSRLVPRLAGRHEVIALVRPGSAAPAHEVETIGADLARLDERRLPDRLDAVVHLAQSPAFRDFPDGAADVFAVNVESTARLLEHARSVGATTFVHASSGSVYGGGRGPLTEDAPLAPRTHYAATKAAADLLVGSFGSILRTVVLRPFAVYGTGQTGMLVPMLLDRLRAGGPIEVQGDPGIRLSPVHVDDAARAFEAALTLDRSDVVNVAGDEEVSLRDLVELLAAADGRSATIRHVGEGDGGSLVGDNARMKTLLGVVPRTTLREGLAELVSASSPES
jgi:UDP-glucose 4-epimerase